MKLYLSNYAPRKPALGYYLKTLRTLMTDRHKLLFQKILFKTNN